MGTLFVMGHVTAQKTPLKLFNELTKHVWGIFQKRVIKGGVHPNFQNIIYHGMLWKMSLTRENGQMGHYGEYQEQDIATKRQQFFVFYKCFGYKIEAHTPGYPCGKMCCGLGQKFWVIILKSIFEEENKSSFHLS